MDVESIRVKLLNKNGHHIDIILVHNIIGGKEGMRGEKIIMIIIV